MKGLRRIWLRIRSLWRRGEVKQEIDQELRLHLEQRTAENLAASLTPEETAREARNWHPRGAGGERVGRGRVGPWARHARGHPRRRTRSERLALAESPLQRLLYEIKPTDPLTLFALPCFLLFVTALSCWLPARRAMRVNPMEALRYE